MSTNSEGDQDVQAAYDAVAPDYDAQFGHELDAKPLERALLRALVELCGRGVIVDVGCGPGHVTRFLAECGADVLGVDLSPAMIALARERAPELPFAVGNMLDLPARNGAWSAVVALYSIIHLGEDDRARAFGEFARVLEPNGWLLVSFHIDSPEFTAGQVNRLGEFLGHPVQLDAHFLDPREIEACLADAGLRIIAKLERRPVPAIEYPSRRCYLLAQRADG